jgi:hypothetical protein
VKAVRSSAHFGELKMNTRILLSLFITLLPRTILSNAVAAENIREKYAVSDEAYTDKEKIGPVQLTFYRIVDQKKYTCDEPTSKIKVVPDTDDEKKQTAGAQTVSLCLKFYDFLRREATGVIYNLDDTGTPTLINYVHKDSETGLLVFKRVDRCRWGLGVKDLCLIPFFTMAADLKPGGYTVGDILYFPALKGLELEDDDIHQIHPGFILVRDTGDPFKDKQKNRGDIFIGAQADVFNHFLSQNGIQSDSIQDAYLLKGESKKIAEDWFKKHYPLTFLGKTNRTSDNR